MKITRFLSLAFSPMLFCGAPILLDAPIAQAQAAPRVVQIKEAGFQFTLPKGWTSERDKTDGSVTVSSPDESCVLILMPTKSDEGEIYAAALRAETKKSNKDFKITQKPTTDVHNGMKHTSESGTCTSEETGPIYWAIDILEAKTPVVIYNITLQKSVEAVAPAFVELITSMKKVG